jgi:hypothetical protein
MHAGFRAVLTWAKTLILSSTCVMCRIYLKSMKGNNTVRIDLQPHFGFNLKDDSLAQPTVIVSGRLD